MYEHIVYGVDGHVATVTLNRPDRLNAVNTAMVNELTEVFDETDADDRVRAVVVTGAGRGFCAGADLSGGADVFTPEPDTAGTVRRDSAGRATLRIFRSRKPIIAAVNGAAVGFGASLTLPMDFRLAAEGAKIGFPFAARGIVPDGASSWFLSKIVGLPRALDLCLSGTLVSAEQALDLGLVRSVHPREELLDAARELAEGIASRCSPVSTALTRQLLWSMAAAPHPMDAHRIESAALSHTAKGPHAREGVAAHLEKRDPSWDGDVSDLLPSWFPWTSEPAYDNGWPGPAA